MGAVNNLSRTATWDHDGTIMGGRWDRHGRPIAATATGDQVDCAAFLSWDDEHTLTWTGRPPDMALAELVTALAAYIDGRRGAACFGCTQEGEQ